MPQPRGRFRSLNASRRFVLDVMHFSRSVPLVVVERRISVSELAKVRLQAEPRPGWLAVFIKAFGLAALEAPQLRQSLLTFPWLRLYEHPGTVAAVTVEREFDDETGVFLLQIRFPESTPLVKIDSEIRHARTAPLREVAAFRRILRMNRIPCPLRRLLWWLGLRVIPSWRLKHFGTFTAGSLVNAGARTLFAWTPLTSYFTFGEIDAEGRVTLRLMFDHRVTDAAPMARALVRMEQILNTTLLEELRHRPA